MFDWYKPVPALVNPITGKAILDDWQSKHGACLLLCWTQGTSTPEWAVEDDLKGPGTPLWLSQQCLPEAFQIYTDDEDGYRCIAECRSVNGVWTESKLIICGKPDKHGRLINALAEDWKNGI